MYIGYTDNIPDKPNILIVWSNIIVAMEGMVQPRRVYVTVSLTYITILQSWRAYVTVRLTYNTILQSWRVYVTISLTYKIILKPLRIYVKVSLTYNIILQKWMYVSMLVLQHTMLRLWQWQNIDYNAAF